jgi:hypothetical protein
MLEFGFAVIGWFTVARYSYKGLGHLCNDIMNYRRAHKQAECVPGKMKLERDG